MLGISGEGNADRIGVWGACLRRVIVVGCLCAFGGASAQDAPTPGVVSGERVSEGQSSSPDETTREEGAPETPETPVDPDGNEFEVGALTLRYFREHPRQPALEELGRLEVTFGVRDGAYVAAREGLASETVRIEDLGDGSVRRMRASAITQVMRTIVEAFKERTIIGVFVAPDPTQMILRDGGIDYRDGETSLALVIYTARVTRVRSIASGKRIDREERIDHPLHARIRERSPVRAHVEGEPEEERRDLLIKDELDDYALRLNRRPGRRVDIAVAPAEGIGNAELQYLVQENKPWSAYFQLSNTGTKSTDKWRERFGFQHTQLTGNDDTLLLEYVTAGFSASHIVSGSYERPISADDKLRLRVDANWNEFKASDVGILNETFTGDGWGVGGELIYNVFQKDELFVDVLGGARFQHIGVVNPGLPGGGVGEEDLFLPRLGVRVERYTDRNSLSGSAVIEWNQAGLTGVSVRDLERLGRIAPDKDWMVLRWDVQTSIFLEPLFNPDGWADVSTPETSTLAHELVLAFRGQYAFNNRLIPQHEAVLGGLYTVRGYDESVVAGDTTLMVSAEYRFHVPRSFDVNPEPTSTFRGKPFKWAPQQVYGRPDWDLVLRAFLDAGITRNSQRLPFERNETLIGAGVGAELLVMTNLSVRADWGFALSDLDNGLGEAGDNRLHFVLTLLF
jgi:hemolysin activation/secretion protein